MRKLMFGMGAAFALAVLLYFMVNGLPWDAEPQTQSTSKADSFTPFLPTGWLITDTKEEILQNINLPFLHKKLVGKRVTIAHIRGSGVEFTSEKASYRNSFLTEGRITLLAATGQLLRVELYTQNDTGPLPGQRSLDQLEDRYRRSSEDYESIPADKSALSIQNILDMVYQGRAEEMEKSKRIEVAYVIHSQQGISGPARTWVIGCFGFPPYPALGLSFGKESPDARTYLRYFLDENGKMLGADNQP